MESARAQATGSFRLVIADDHPMVADGFARVLARSHRVVGVTSDPSELLEVVSEQTDCLLLDLSMRHRNGLEQIPLLKRRYPQLKIVMVTMHNERVIAEAALDAGADGFVPKYAGSGELLVAISEVMAGRRYLSRLVPRTSHALATEAAHPALATLTARHQQIVLLMGEGLSPLQIAEELRLSPSAITFHKHRIMQQLGVTSDQSLRRLAITIREAVRERARCGGGGGERG